MNSIPTVLPKKIQDVFQKIETRLDTELYFYGSVTRSDYIPGKSDIDVAIFTDNEYSEMSKLQHILHLNRGSFDKIVWKLNGTMIYGYKVQLQKMNCEISIFNNNFKQLLLDEYLKPNKNQSIFIFCLIYILKLLYYQIPLLSKPTYTSLKRYIMNQLIEPKESVYLLLKQNK
jgi:hypothetical protein